MVKNMEINTRASKTLIKCIYKTVCLVNQYNKLYLPINLFFMIVQGFIPAILLFIMKNAINLLQRGGDDFTKILRLLLLYIGLNILNSLLSWWYSYYSAQFNMKFSQYVNIKMLNKAANLQVCDFENTSTYDIINRAQTQNGNSILNYISENFLVIKAFVTIGSTCLVLIKFKWWVIILILLIPIIRCIVTIIIDKKWYVIRKERTSKERKKWYINYLMMMGIAVKEIKLFAVSQYLIEKYKTITENIIDQDLRIQKKISIAEFVLDICDWTITGFLYVYVVFQGFVGLFMIGDVTTCINGIDKIKSSADSVFSGIENMTEQSLYIDFLFQYLEIPIKIKSEKIKITHIEKIELVNVSYKYDENNYALKNINMVLNKDSHIALIGANGSGKTTLIKVIMGLYDDYEGEIFINDINMREIDVEEYQKKVSCIFQDYVKYEMSIRENIGLGNVQNIFNEKVLREQIERVHLENRISETDSLDLNLGNWFGGIELSGGEWQRIAIARMLMKNAELFILDEPDASLDALKQKEMIKIYEQEMKGNISIYISHKVDYVNLISNCIYVLANGEIVEVGDSEQLFDRKGIYYQLVNECNKKMKSCKW